MPCAVKIEFENRIESEICLHVGKNLIKCANFVQMR